MSAAHLVVLCTAPDAPTASRLAETLVAERLAACANLLPAVQSVYRWEGKVERAAEVLLIIKTTAAHYPALEARLRELHPYEVPEIIALPITAGSAPYLRWLDDNT
jgi:periplasmic divalent cation tolerance protein